MRAELFRSFVYPHSKELRTKENLVCAALLILQVLLIFPKLCANRLMFSSTFVCAVRFYYPFCNHMHTNEEHVRWTLSTSGLLRRRLFFANLTVGFACWSTFHSYLVRFLVLQTVYSSRLAVFVL